MDRLCCFERERAIQGVAALAKVRMVFGDDQE
jgi:hypothetical protein